SPIRAGNPASQWTTALSWMLVSRPTTTRSSSARRTAPNRTTAPSPMVTSPRTVALGATKAVGWIRDGGSSDLTLGHTDRNVAAFEADPAHDADRGGALHEAVLVDGLGPFAEQGPDGRPQPGVLPVLCGLRLQSRWRLRARRGRQRSRQLRCGRLIDGRLDPGHRCLLLGRPRPSSRRMAGVRPMRAAAGGLLRHLDLSADFDRGLAVLRRGPLHLRPEPGVGRPGRNLRH